MLHTRFHTTWLFIFNAFLIALTPLIRGPGNYLAFTLIFLGTNLLILSFVWQAIENGSLEIVLSPLHIVSFIFLGIILSSLFFTISPPSTRYGFFTMASVIIDSAFLSFMLPENKIWKRLASILAITVFILSVIALYQYLTGHGSFEGRGHATFVNPNSFAGYLLLTMPILTGLYLVSEKTKYAAAFFILTLLCFGAILTTGTGGRWILLAGAVGTALLLFWIFAKHVGKRLVFLAVGFLAVLLIFLAPIGNNAASFSPNPATISGSTMDRLNIWKSTWEVIKEHPIRGVGFWGFHTIYSKYKNKIYKDVTHYFSHNDYLQLWAELGLIGVGVFLVLVLICFREGFRCLKILPLPPDRIMLLSTLIGSFLVLIHTISDFDLYISSVLFLFWGCIAYTTSTARELGLCKIKVIDLNQFRIFTLLGRKKLYIITAGILAFLSLWVSDPYLAGLYNDRGKGYVAKGEYEKAVKFFSKAVELDPIDDSYHFNLGLALARHSSDPAILAKAENEMNRAATLAPYRSDIYSDFANFYRTFYLKEKGKTAVDMLRKARDLDPLDITITHNLGVLYLEMGLYKDAVTEFKNYLEDKPKDIDARIEISEAYRMNKEYDNAMKEIDWLLKKENMADIPHINKNYANFLKGRIFKDNGNYTEAFKWYQLALKEKGKESEVWYEIGLLYLKQNKPKEAEEAFRKAVDYLSLDPLEGRDGNTAIKKMY